MARAIARPARAPIRRPAAVVIAHHQTLNRVLKNTSSHGRSPFDRLRANGQVPDLAKARSVRAEPVEA
ncbi:MAG: hypothetical protein MZV65_18380 [Chromatiales bacterium]|nr:hypothetical protein [Chromatiales bacterium]